MRIVLEDVASSAIQSQMSEPNRQLLLSDLDRLPVGARAEWGQLLPDMLAGRLREHLELPRSCS
jgi:hypothetical protein